MADAKAITGSPVPMSLVAHPEFYFAFRQVSAIFDSIANSAEIGDIKTVVALAELGQDAADRAVMKAEVGTRDLPPA